MKKLKTILHGLILLLLLSGCFGPKGLQRQVNRKTYDPVIFHKSELLKEKSNILMRFQFKDSSNLPEQTLVTKKRGSYIPLIFVYLWDYDMVVKLGNSSSNPKGKELMRKILKEVFERSGDFTIISNSDNGSETYRSIITIKKVDVTCNYNRNGTYVFAYGEESETADKSTGNIIINLQLFDRAGNLIYEKDYEENRVVNFVGSSNEQAKVKHEAMQNLLENLTLSTEAIGIEMIKHINAKIK